MKTRYLTLFLTATGAVFAIGGCSGSSTLDPNVEARLRNDLPSVCTAAQIQACPAVEVTQCPNGQEPVIDYSSDCCAHFTCQPICQVANRSCLMTPAPVCPAGTKLWIGTAVEDCCPAYRCEPDGSTCDPTKQAAAACTLALPYCGPNVDPVVVGQTSDCCPIYQCPCVTPVMTDPATGTPPPSATDVRYCGCTTPSCKAGEEVVCEGKDACMGPCSCQPARGICKTDANCAADERCDLSACRLPPAPATTMAAECDPSKCGPQLGIANRVCADGTVAGPTNRCLLNADGSCGWEIISCPSDGCYGICAPNIQSGCKASTDCPTGQTCEVSCGGWGCSTGGTPTTSTGMTVPPATVCACPASDPSCMCDASGNCSGQTCAGKCVPGKPTCDPATILCPAIAIVCPDGSMPVSDGTDPMTCCPAFHCPTCNRPTTATGTTAACPAIKCACAKIVGTDPTSCCPTYECGMVNADGSCA